MDLGDLKNRYEDERIFIIGNGPSLERTPLDALSNEYTFAVNNIANIFDQTEWRPSFYLAIHSPPNIPKRNVLKVVDLNVPVFLPRNGLTYAPDRDNVLRVNIKHLIENEDVDITRLNVDFGSIDEYRDVWSDNVSKVVYHYTTVLYPAMQIAHYLGFNEFYLLGCDLYDEWNLHMICEKGDDPALHQSDSDSRARRIYEFLSSSDYPLRSLANGLGYRMLNSTAFRKAQPLLMKLDDRFANQVHFYDTFDVGEFLAGNKIRNKEMIQSHELAKEVSSDLGFDIYNATFGGSLEVYPRVDFDELLAQ